jgi:hypothetical protein
LYNDVIILQINCPHVSSMLSICLVPDASVALRKNFPPIIRNLLINFLNVKFVSSLKNYFLRCLNGGVELLAPGGLATIYTDFFIEFSNKFCTASTKALKSPIRLICE